MSCRKFEELKVSGKTDQECVDEIVAMVRRRMEASEAPMTEHQQNTQVTGEVLQPPLLERRPSKRAPNAPDVPTRRRSFDLLRLGSMDASSEKPQRNHFLHHRPV